MLVTVFSRDVVIELVNEWLDKPKHGIMSLHRYPEGVVLIRREDTLKPEERR